MQLSMVVTVTDHHQHEKRHGRVLSRRQLGCAWFKLLGTIEDVPVKPDHLAYELTLRYCITCNAQHWFFGDRVEYIPPQFNPEDYFTTELEEMGFFAQFDDAIGDNH